MMDRPYRKLGRPKLQAIAKEKWDSPYVLKKIEHELSLRDSSVWRKDVQNLYESVLSRLKELGSMAEIQSGGGKLRLRLQEIEELRLHADSTGYFKWPTTDALMGDGMLDTSGWYELGLFRHVGYHVGNDGEHLDVRHYLLDCIFHNKLPSVNSDKYMNEFASPQSPQRLHKMANVLASSAIKLKGKTNADCSQAIEDYESDLDYLYDKYYVEVFNFGWPRI